MKGLYLCQVNQDFVVVYPQKQVYLKILLKKTCSKLLRFVILLINLISLIS